MSKLFPIMSNCRKGMEVLWEDAKKAYEAYNRRFPGQSMEEMAARGGFGVEEFVYFFHGFIGPTDKEWPTDVCKWCQGDGSGLELPGEKIIRCHPHPGRLTMQARLGVRGQDGVSCSDRGGDQKWSQTDLDE